MAVVVVVVVSSEWTVTASFRRSLFLLSRNRGIYLSEAAGRAGAAKGVTSFGTLGVGLRRGCVF